MFENHKEDNITDADGREMAQDKVGEVSDWQIIGNLAGQKLFWEDFII